MKYLYLLILLSFCWRGALGQQQNNLFVFEKEGKLILNKGISSTYHNSIVGIDVSRVNQPSSTYFQSLSALVGKIQSLHDTPISANDCLFKSLKDTLPMSTIMAVIGQSANRFLVSDTTQHYLPFKLASIPAGLNAPTTLTVAGSSTLNNVPFSLSVIDQMSEFQLIRQNYDNQILANQLNNSIRHYKGLSVTSNQLIDSLRTVFDHSAPRIATILFFDSLHVSGCTSCAPVTHSFQISLVDELIPLYNAFARTEALYNKVLCDNSEWIKSWLWYTGGDIRLNPFGFFDPTPSVQQVNIRIQQLEKRLTLLQSYSACCNNKLSDYKETAAKIDTLIQQINTFKNLKEQFIKETDDYQKWVNDHSVESVVLYKNVILPVNTRNHINWQHHYDAANKFNFVTPKNQLPDMVADIDQTVVLVHNVKAGDSISLKAIDTLFVPKTKLQVGLESITQALVTATGFTSPIKAITSAIAQNFNPKNRKAPIVNLSDIEEKAYNAMHDLFSTSPKTIFRDIEKGNKLVSIVDTLSKTSYEDSQLLVPKLIGYIDNLRGKRAAELTAKLYKLLNAPNPAVYLKLLYDELGVQNIFIYNSLITSFKTSRNNLNWLLAQTIPIRSINLVTNEIPKYQTIVEYPERTLELNSSKTVSYKLFVNKNKESTISRKYNKYERVRWWPTVGFSYIPRNRSGSIFDSTSQQFKMGTNFDNFEALVGVKLYFLPTNPARNHVTKRFIKENFGRKYNIERGNSFENTLFFTFGLGVRHQFLRNYYAGVGSDIVPGLSWTAGANFIFQKRYELENGSIKNQYERPQSFLYIGLCIDPGVIINLASIFK